MRPSQSQRISLAIMRTLLSAGTGVQHPHEMPHNLGCGPSQGIACAVATLAGHSYEFLEFSRLECKIRPGRESNFRDCHHTRSRMPGQVTVSDVAETSGSGVDRGLLIDGRLVTTDKMFSSINPATGEVAVVGGGK